jgi:hypothetical protein
MARTCAYCSSSINDSDAFCQACGRPAPATRSAGTLADHAQPAVAAVPTGGLPSWAAVPPTTGPPATGPAATGLPTADRPTTGRPVSFPSAAAAPGGANDAYLGHRLTYTVPSEPTFDPLGSSRFIAQVALRAVLYTLTYLLGLTVFLILFLLTNHQVITDPLNSGTSAFGGATVPGPGINGFGTFLGVVFFLFDLVLVISFWFGKIPIQLSEWKLTVDGKAAAAPMVFSHIAAVLYQRGTPIAPLRVQRFRLPRVGDQDYLELHSHIFYGYVACFAYGQDLYIGWTFWSKLSPIRYVFMFIARIYRSLFNRGSDLYTSLRYDSARAMRETMHSATREGVDVAVGRLAAQGQGIVGTAIPVTEHAVIQ